MKADAICLEGRIYTGVYLAGVEGEKDKQASDGWTQWVMPSRQYLITQVQPEIYGEVFSQVIEKEIPARNLKLYGAVCDHTDPATGKNQLFFPVCGESDRDAEIEGECDNGCQYV